MRRKEGEAWSFWLNLIQLKVMATTAAQKKSTQATQELVPIEQIRDGIVILKNQSLCLVLMVSSLNFALKSSDEQIAILLQFQNFLNSLDFHIQIFVQSRRLDIRPYLNTLEERLAAQTNDLLKVQTREYIGFIKNFTETTEIMSKNFFVVVPYAAALVRHQSGGGPLSFFRRQKATATQKTTDFEEQRMQLEQRAAVVEQGFRSLGLRIAPLGTEELVELYGKLFNPGQNSIPTLITA